MFNTLHRAFFYFFFAILSIALTAQGAFAITIDGNLADWSHFDRLDIIPAKSGVAGHELYNTFDTATNQYQFAIKSNQIGTGKSAIVYINSDFNNTTGFKVFGSTVGAEYVISITNTNQTTLKATLYRYTNFTSGATAVVATLPVKTLTGAAEFSLTRSLLVGSPAKIGLYFSLNNTVYLPKDYSIYQYVAQAVKRPLRTNFTKRIAIVHSATTAARYFDPKAYSQLFMSAQHQAMMAGVPYDLLTEDQLLDIKNLLNYDTIVFPLFSHVKAANRVTTENVLTEASIRYRIGMIASGNFLTNDQTGAAFSIAPYRTHTAIFGVAPVSAGTATSIKLVPADVTHPVMKNYQLTDVLRLYQKTTYTTPTYHIFAPVTGAITKVLVNQVVNGSASPGAGVIASQADSIGGRNLHFATDLFLGDTDLLWSGLRWSVGGAGIGSWLQMGRHKSLFFSRNDMDQAKVFSMYNTVLTPLKTVITDWKNKYNFVGSYYIDIGNNVAAGEYTDWVRNTPYYKSLIALGNEIGNHSYTHAEGKGPNGENYAVLADTNKLTDAQLTFEFKTSNALLQTKLGTPVTGAAVPGMPDTLATALKIEQIARFAHLTGSFSGIDYSLGLTLGAAYERNEGAGFHGAFGYLNPTSSMLYFSPNLTPDFTIIQFRKQTPATATKIWKDQITDLLKFASQPILQWAWHDYSVTTGLTDNPPYTKAMYEDTIKYALQNDAEFVTGQDLTARIPTLLNSKIVFAATNPYDVTVSGSNLGTFSLFIDKARDSTNIIKNVANWYAYSNTRVFLPEAGGRFITTLGATADDVTRITSLPMRARLKTVTGNGSSLQFSFEGEGVVVVTVKSTIAANAIVTGADSVVKSGTKYTLKFNTKKLYTVKIN